MTSIPTQAISSEALDPTLSNTAASNTTSTTERNKAKVDSDFYLGATQSKLDTPLTCDKTTDGCVTSGTEKGMSDGPAAWRHRRRHGPVIANTSGAALLSIAGALTIRKGVTPGLLIKRP